MAEVHDERFADAEVLPFLKLLQKPRRGVPRINGENSEKDAECRVKGELQNVSRPKQLKALVRKRGKRGESAAKTDGQKKPRVRIQTVCGKPVKQPDEKTADDIDGESSHRKSSATMRPDELCRKESANAADKASETDQKNRTNHIANLKTRAVFPKWP